eukprot:g4672.t1
MFRRRSPIITALLMVSRVWVGAFLVHQFLHNTYSVFLGIAYLIEAQYPVLHTPFHHQFATVEDVNTRQVLPVEAGFHKFFCNGDQNRNIASCERNLIIYTRSPRIDILLSWINHSGEFGNLPENSNFSANVAENNEILHVEHNWHRQHLVLRLTIKKDAIPIPIYCEVRGISTKLTIIRDTIPPKPSISLFIPEVDIKTGKARLLVRFSEKVFGQKMVNCSHQEANSSLLSLHERIESSRTCQLFAFELSIHTFINVTRYLGAKLYRLDDSVYLTVDFDKAKQTNIEVTVPPESIWDIAGNPNTERDSFVIYYRPTMDSKTAGLILGQVATGAVAGTIAVSAASGGAIGVSGQSIPFFLLGLLQKLFLIGNIAVADMPDLYVDFAGQLGWAMFDFPSPFEAFVKKDNERNKKEESLSEEAVDERVKMRTRADAFIYFARVFFWVPLVLILLLLVHLLLILLLLWRKKSIPFIFTFPRLELVFIYWALPALATAIAGLYRGDKRDAFIATWLLIALPGSVLTGNLYLMWDFFYSKKAKDRNANFVVSSSKKDPRALTEIMEDWKRKIVTDFETKRGSPIFFVNALYNGNNHNHRQNPQCDSASDSQRFNSSLVATAAAADANKDSVHLNYASEITVCPLEKEPMTKELNCELPLGTGSQTWSGVNGCNTINGLSVKDEESSLVESSPSSREDLNETSPFATPFTPQENQRTRLDEPMDSGFGDGDACTSSGAQVLPRKTLLKCHTAPDYSHLNRETEVSNKSKITHRASSTAEHISTTGVQIKPLEMNRSHHISEGSGMIENRMNSRVLSWKRLSMKRVASERLRSKTSNNIAALLTSTSAIASTEVPVTSVDAPESSHIQSHFINQEIKRIDQAPLTEEAWRADAIVPGFRSSDHNRRRTNNAPVRTEKQDFSPQRAPMLCSKAPDPVWKFDELDRIFEEFTKEEKPSSLKDFQERNEMEADYEVQSVNDVFMRLTREPSGVLTERSLANGRSDPNLYAAIQFSDYPTTLEPEPFAETKARLRFINKECLKDIQCRYLVDSDTESSSSYGRSDVEYKYRSKLSKKQQRQPRSKTTLFWTLLGEAMDAGFYSFVFGQAQLKGVWKFAPQKNVNFISQYGYLFEDFRGHPVLYREPTYIVKDAVLDRGKFIPLKVPPVFEIKPRRILMTRNWRTPLVRIYQHQIQLMTKVLGLVKIVVLGCFVAGVGSGRDSLVQIVILLTLCVVLFLTLRIAQPYRTRYNMAIALLEDISDVAFLAFAMLLVLGPSENETYRKRIGIGMISAELMSLLALLLDRLSLALVGFTLIWRSFRSRKPSQVRLVFQQYLKKNRYYYERKYLDAWMVKALKRGLYNRVVLREELPVSFVVTQYIRQWRDSVHWCKQELQLVLLDFKQKLRTLSPVQSVRDYSDFIRIGD